MFWDFCRCKEEGEGELLKIQEFSNKKIVWSRHTYFIKKGHLQQCAHTSILTTSTKWLFETIFWAQGTKNWYLRTEPSKSNFLWSQYFFLVHKVKWIKVNSQSHWYVWETLSSLVLWDQNVLYLQIIQTYRRTSDEV